MDVSRYAALFLTESREHLQACNRLLLELERVPMEPAPIAGIFRAIHTLKGMAATMGYARLAELAHQTEDLLALLRERVAAVDPDQIDLLFRAVDALEASLDEAVAGRDDQLDFTALLAALTQSARATRSHTGEMRAVREVHDLQEAPGPRGPSGRLVRVAIRGDAVMRGARAALALKRAESLGAVSGIRPAVAAFEQAEFDGRFSFRLDTDLSDQAVQAAIRAAGDVESVTVGDMPVHAPVEETTAEVRSIRVDLRRLDSLLNNMGELVVAEQRLQELVAPRSHPELEAVSARIHRLVSELQADVIQVRLTPVWQVFDRFPRVVRDLGRQLGKRVELLVEGGDIELDRAILDELGDPLLHLLRNALDHGIESPGERRRKGKSEVGRIVLSATRDQRGVAVRVADDGRGLDRSRIVQRAVQDGVLEAEAEALSDEGLLRLIARPGFSTASRVTDVSGRGVGIDAVVDRVRALGGSVAITSELGRGTTFTLYLPVTLAVLRVLLARVGQERYALPLAHVTETVEYDAGRLTTMGGREALVLREAVIPTRHIRELLRVDQGELPPRRPTIILESAGQRAAVVVDALLGQQEIVVEPFDPPRGMLPVFSGATILADGEPALILDAAALV